MTVPDGASSTITSVEIVRRLSSGGAEILCDRWRRHDSDVLQATLPAADQNSRWKPLRSWSDIYMAAIVLVHGAWQGAWCWSRVVHQLGERGMRTLVIELPGHGDDPGPLGDLHGDAMLVRQVLDGIDEPVVLAGHAYGGAVITEAGDHPAVRELVYIAGFVLDAGESCVSATAKLSDAARISWEGQHTLAEGFVTGPKRTITLDPMVAGARLYNDCDASTIAWAVAHLGPQRLDNLRGVPGAIAWRSKPSVYVVCADDLAVHPDLERAFAGRCTSSVEWPTSHSPFLSRPDLVAGLLGELATAAA